MHHNTVRENITNNNMAEKRRLIYYVRTYLRLYGVVKYYQLKYTVARVYEVSDC
jgi:hypothetical protein